mgnify:CR=1 FL=1
MAKSRAPARGAKITLKDVADREFVLTCVLDAPRDRVWEAWTRPEQVSRWLLGPEGWTMPLCEMDLRPGGSWRYGWSGPDGATMETRGKYQEIEPPERLVTTESWGKDWPETVNTLLFTEGQGRTTITCRILYASSKAREEALATGMEQGLAASLERLASHLRAPAP